MNDLRLMVQLNFLTFSFCFTYRNSKNIVKFVCFFYPFYFSLNKTFCIQKHNSNILRIWWYTTYYQTQRSVFFCENGEKQTFIELKLCWKIVKWSYCTMIESTIMIAAVYFHNSDGRKRWTFVRLNDIHELTLSGHHSSIQIQILQTKNASFSKFEFQLKIIFFNKVLNFQSWFNNNECVIIIMIIPLAYNEAIIRLFSVNQ